MFDWTWSVLPTLWVGATVMVCAGALSAAWLFYYTVGRIDRLWKGLVSLHYLREAVDEWKKNHPEKAAKFDRIEGNSDD